ncbi:hypothetical protein ACQ86O_16255 [Serratia sp. L9]
MKMEFLVASLMALCIFPLKSIQKLLMVKGSVSPGKNIGGVQNTGWL